MIQYVVDQDALRIQLFGILTVRRVSLNDIDDARIVAMFTEMLPFSKGFRLAFLWAERWPSYMFQRRAVIIHKRTGISRLLVLTPKSPEQFVESLRRTQSGGTRW